MHPSALGGKRGYHWNIWCNTWSAECDCPSNFISVLEDFKLLYVLLICAERSTDSLSTEYWWYHSKMLSLIGWDHLHGIFLVTLMSNCLNSSYCSYLFGAVWQSNSEFSYFRCKIMKKSFHHTFPQELNPFSHIELLFTLTHLWVWSTNCQFRVDVHTHTLTEHLYNLHKLLGHFACIESMHNNQLPNIETDF